MTKAYPIMAPGTFNAFSGNHTITASSSESGHPPENLEDPRRYLTWKPSATANYHNVTVQMGAQYAVKCFGLSAHNCGSLGVEVLLRASDDDITYVTIDTLTPSDDKTVFKLVDNTTPYYYWRLAFTKDGVTPFTGLEVGVVMAGNYIQFERYPDDGYDPYQRKRHRRVPVSVAGEPLGSVKSYDEIRMNLNFSYLSESFINNFVAWYDKFGDRPYWFAWDINEHPNDILYGMLPEDWEMVAPIGLADLRTLNLQMTGVFE